MNRRNNNTVSCAEMQEMVIQYIENRLPESELVAFLNHIENCPSCKEDLMVNYSILTAIEQLSNDEDFSDSYVDEMEAKLSNSRLGILRGKRKMHRLRFLCLALMLCCGFVIGLSSAKDPVRYYLPEESESTFRLNYYGIPEGYDPVYDTLIEYNDEVIAKLRELNKGE